MLWSRVFSCTMLTVSTVTSVSSISLSEAHKIVSRRQEKFKLTTEKLASVLAGTLFVPFYSRFKDRNAQNKIHRRRLAFNWGKFCTINIVIVRNFVHWYIENEEPSNRKFIRESWTIACNLISLVICSYNEKFSLTYIRALGSMANNWARSCAQNLDTVCSMWCIVSLYTVVRLFWSKYSVKKPRRCWYELKILSHLKTSDAES